MPLFLIAGYPTSGKTFRSTQLTEYLTARIADLPSTSPLKSLSIVIHSDESLGIQRTIYGDAKKEKEARAAMFAAIQRSLGKNVCVIAEGNGSFIKGWRYQVYCEGKAAGVKGCVIHVGTSISECRSINNRLQSQHPPKGYSEPIFDDLVTRFEEPDARSRWDKPLFTVPYEDATPPLKAIWDAMIEPDTGGKNRRIVVKPHTATVLTPAAESDYLYELDKVTQNVVGKIMAWQKDHDGEAGGSVDVSDDKGDDDQESDRDGERLIVVNLPATVSVGLPQLQRMRRSFVGLMRGRQIERRRVREAFAEYLSDGFG
ncbi:hypothetical protein MMC25_000481 [Agyrium rufum]|nr:hypothetical protein [Agyrium rufum]